MRHFAGAVVVSCSLVFAAPCALAEQASQAVLEELLTIERAALDRWLRFDPEGYLGVFAPDISYFDPTAERPQKSAHRSVNLMRRCRLKGRPHE